ncbi:MAG: GNAT family N-acetyltransferase, partial [Pseudomonadota bacterium]|nr:GNAT family N-acetyltransferase [Pseudomonadota bacterium]
MARPGHCVGRGQADRNYANYQSGRRRDALFGRCGGEEAYIGRGFGAQMMGLALQMCFDEYGADAVLIDPLVGNTRALRFYKRSGYDELSGGASALTIVLSIGWTAKT